MSLVFFAIIQVALPLFVIAQFWRPVERAHRDLALHLLLGAAFIGFASLVLPWGILPYWLRWLWPALFLAAAIRAVLRQRGRDVSQAKSAPALNGIIGLAFTAMFGAQIVGAIQARSYPGEALDLQFPLEGGAFVVGHGGSRVGVNYHNAHPVQRYALDISGLNAVGLRAWSLGPAPLDRYAVWGQTLHSPCDAVVRSVVVDLPDHQPPKGDPDNPAGNHVELQVGDIRICLAHMQRGSVLVKKGDRVRAGDPLGKVGKSGNTTEPHLHIHAVRGGESLRDGEGVPITFNGRFLVRNDVVR